MRLLFFMILLSPMISHAQHENDIWYFGDSIGLDFRNGGSPEVLGNSGMVAQWACATICDEEGKLLFYSNGQSVWNKNHEIMPNGNGLAGGEYSKAMLLVKKPGSQSRYVILTTDMKSVGRYLSYYEIDMKLDGGLGDLDTTSSKSIRSYCLEILEPVRHANGIDIWVVTHTRKDSFLSFLLSIDGINPNPVVTQIGDEFSHVSGSSIAFCPVNEKLAASFGSTHHVPLAFHLLDFNRANGTLSNLITVRQNSGTNQRHGLEFSPSGEFLYQSETAHPGTVYQYSILLDNEQEIQNSGIAVGRGYNGISGGELRLGPDGIIYFSRWREEFIATILNPDSAGLKCTYIDTAIYIGFWNGVHQQLKGLPNHLEPIRLELDARLTCLPDSTYFFVRGPTLKFTIDYGDGAIDTIQNAISNKFSHRYKAEGNYRVILKSTSPFERTVVKNIAVSKPPEINFISDTSICESDKIYVKDIMNINTQIFHVLRSINSPISCSPDPYDFILKNECGVQQKSVTVSCIHCDCNYYLMNVITPNKDELNETVRLNYHNCAIDQFEFLLYNRWGSLIYRTDNPDFEISVNDLSVSGDVLFYTFSMYVNKNKHFDSGILHVLK